MIQTENTGLIVRRLSTSEWSLRYRNGFERVFRRTDPFDAPFQESVSARAILYPVSYLLDETDFAAVTTAARAVGDGALCLTITDDRKGLLHEGAKHWLLDLSYRQYASLGEVGVLENALYSPTGRWGMITSHESHAVLGGSRDFLDEFFRAQPALLNSPESFLQYWDERTAARVDTGWVRPLLEHIYGKAETNRLLHGRPFA